MSEESNAIALSTKKDENLENEKGIMEEDNDTKPALSSDESPLTENMEIPAEQVHVQENPPFEPAGSEKQSKPVLGYRESNVEATDSSPEQKLNKSDASTDTKSLESTIDANEPVGKSPTSDASTETESLERTIDANEPVGKSTTSVASTETKSLERTIDANEPVGKSTTSVASNETKSLERTIDANEPVGKSTTSDASTETKSLGIISDVGQSTVKSTTSNGTSPSRVPASDEGLEKVTENIQLINEGLKGMKISAEEIPVSASAKKGRKPPTTPRARSTPVMTSPPLTRSRSRDLRKLPSTPASPRSSGGRKTSDSDAEEVKVRGRQRLKKN